jgi:hypothetical protein
MSLRKTIRALIDPDKIVTPAYRRWLRNHSDDPYPDWVVELIAKELRKQQRDRTGSFSGSSAGACLRAQEFGFLGVNPPVETLPSTDLIGIFDDGRWRHLRWQANLLTARILSSIEVTLDWPTKRSKGSMDGMGVVPADHPNPRWRGLDFGFELKGMNGFQYARAVKDPLPIEKHLYQVDRYFLSSGVDLFVVLYECKLTQKIHEWVIERDDLRIKESEEELDDLNMAVDIQELHPQLKSCSHRMGPNWQGCPYAGKGGICETWRDEGKTWL